MNGLTEEQRTLHALNRFTFGPRPGEEASVQKMGLDAWFAQQLHPELIRDAALEARLQQFPAATRISLAELEARFPSPGTLRRYSRGGIEAPTDPAERAIYADAGYLYQQRLNAAKLGDAAKAAGNSGGTQAPSAKGKPEGDAGSAIMNADSTEPAMSDSLPMEKTGKKAHKATVPPMDAAQVEALLALAPEARFERLVAMTPERMEALRGALPGPKGAALLQGLTPGQAEQIAAMRGPGRVVSAEVTETRLLRDIYSDRQLQAVMTDFWLNHFNVYLRKNQNEPYFLPAYQRETILPHALGRFEDLLVATAESPAMLTYLDNWQSTGPNSPAAQRLGRGPNGAGVGPRGKAANKLPRGINENYARELMELHTLGVNGGYTQKDVIEVAKCFTGWTVERPGEGGGFVFDPRRHEPGSKIVLGHTIPEGGESEGLAVLHILASSPATAHFISTKLAQRFVSDAPPPALVDRLSATFLSSGGDLKAVLTTLYHSPEFWSPAVYRAKVKTPLEFLVSGVRAGDGEVENALPLVASMMRLGMPLYGMQTPNGYSWQGDAWVSSNALLTRMNFALLLSGDRLPGTRLHWPGLAGTEAGDAAVQDKAMEARLETVILGQPASERTREAVLAQAKDPALQRTAEDRFLQGDGAGDEAEGNGLPEPVRRDRLSQPEVPSAPIGAMSGLLLGSPDFQRR